MVEQLDTFWEQQRTEERRTQDGEQLHELADQRREAVNRLADVPAHDVVAELTADEELVGLRREAAEKLGLTEVNVRELRDLSTDLSRLGGQASAVGRLLTKDTRLRRRVVTSGCLVALLTVARWASTSGGARGRSAWRRWWRRSSSPRRASPDGCVRWSRPPRRGALSKAVGQADAIESAHAEAGARREVVLTESLKAIEAREECSSSRRPTWTPSRRRDSRTAPNRPTSALVRRDSERLSSLLGGAIDRVVVSIDDLDTVRRRVWRRCCRRPPRAGRPALCDRRGRRLPALVGLAGRVCAVAA